MSQPKGTTANFKEDLWQAYLNEAGIHYPKISPAPGLKEFINGHVGDRLTEIENMPEGPDKDRIVAGAFVCVKSAGYISAMYARTEDTKSITLTLTESSYKKSYDVVKLIYHSFFGERICD
tara:strand:+ start:233 stop:595 length:363 start_codon:yes stop_codon:yes gene_type:complete